MAALETVIPLQDKQEWTGRSAVATATPEPAKLYHLILLALFLHGPATGVEAEHCRQCQRPWPCPQACLACRLLDGL